MAHHVSSSAAGAERMPAGDWLLAGWGTCLGKAAPCSVRGPFVLCLGILI